MADFLGMPQPADPVDAWDDIPQPQKARPRATPAETPATAGAVDGSGMDDSAVDDGGKDWGEDAVGFLLGVPDVLAQVGEEAAPITAGRWRALVMEGKAPAPLGWEPPLWGYDAVAVWIPQALETRILEPAPKATAEEVPDRELVYGSTAEWVTRFLVPVYRRQLTATGDRTTWCPKWWKHAEAIIRLEALWRAWEHLRLDGRTGMSVWLKDHLDHHLPVLTDAHAGPFTGCRPDRHAEEPLGEFQLVAPPPEWFPDVREPNNDNSEGGRRP